MNNDKKLRHIPEMNEAEKARHLMRWASKAYLATELQPGLKAADSPGGRVERVAGNFPYASLSLVALDHDATPYMLLSDLADHSQNLIANPRAGMLFDGTAGYRDPLAGGRVTLVGTLRKVNDPRMLQRFLSRHPGSALYAGFNDFSLYHYEIEAAHLIGGFAKAVWVTPDILKLDCGEAGELSKAETSIVEHMNTDHTDALLAIATQTLGLHTAKWKMTGIDPEGWDLHDGRSHARCQFPAPVRNANEARQALVIQAKAARS
ncbi:DUF2470 domain-containing protein [Kiloniella laminariae]|uniref:DUF2470 domain-containing protein n=1 Tax=Kiloniella laminariae TaxID=454162 RepID=A0ABT4LJU6_9PROT|nr:DUF2470 domain-containing protein [Kiloniella laminariae]MCZ4281361.1 DUF2470 domain-containing protein [Kiloniella laminariae]